MIKCPSCDFENADSAGTCERCGVILCEIDPICGMPMFGGDCTGQVLSRRYIIVCEISSDELGKVYQAEDAQLDKAVMIRALPRIFAEHKEQINALCKEAEIVGGLSHPNIVRLLGFESGRTVKYLVSEYDDGLTLEEIISSEGSLSVEKALKIFLPVATALDYAHSRNILHKDIRPGNIILTKAGQAKLTNFGISRQIVDSMVRINGKLTGQASVYMAPEQFSKGKIQRQSDIYSLAACIYQSLCSPPLSWRGWLEYQVLCERPSPVSLLSNEQNAALLKALSRDPRDRQSRAVELLNELRMGSGAAIAITTAEAARKTTGYTPETQTPAEKIVYSGAAAKAGEQTEARAMPRTSKEVKAKAFTRAKAPEQVRTRAGRLVQAIEKIGTTLGTAVGVRWSFRTDSKKPTSKIEVFVVVLGLATLITGAVLSSYHYAKYRRHIAEARREWAAAQLSADQQDYADAILTADTVITRFPRYAKGQKVHLIRAKWEEILAARELWDKAKLLANQSRYELAINKGKELLRAYPEIYNAGEIETQLAEWEKIVLVKKQVDELRTRARRAKDANELDVALEAVAAVLELPEWGSQVLKTGIEEAKEALRTAAEREQRFERLKGEALLLESRQDWESAEKLYTKALSIKPNDLPVKDRRAVCQHNIHLSQGQAAEAKGDLERAVELYMQALSYKNSPSTQTKLRLVQAALQVKRSAERRRMESEKWMRLASEAEAQGDLAKAVEGYRKAAEAGNPTAMYKLGSAYHNGVGLSRDYGNAMQWLGCAANAGNCDAMFDLGMMYYNGDGVTQDFCTALEWLIKAAEKGNSLAMFNVAVMYGEGYGVNKDIARSIWWYYRAAKEGNIRAMFNLGMMYYQGSCVPRDYAKAIKWLTAAAESGDAMAMFNLGLIYYEGRGVSKDYPIAVDWYRKAAGAGDSKAMSKLALAYYTGVGVGKDYQKAIGWYRRAAKAGDSEAMYNLGVIYHNGDGVAKDDAQAMEWFGKAAEAGDSEAMYNLGVMYDSGAGVSKDAQQAIKWYQRAARLGYDPAKQELIKLGKAW